MTPDSRNPSENTQPRAGNRRPPARDRRPTRKPPAPKTVKRLDSKLEEAIASLPHLAWFDSRNSGDVIGYAHKALWVLACGGMAHLFGFPAWYGGLCYLSAYTPLKIHGTQKAWVRWKRGESKLGPWKDERTHKSGIYVGIFTDAILDLGAAALVTLLFYKL